MKLKAGAWIWVSLLLTAVLCGVSLKARMGAESRNKAVGLAVEMATVHRLAAAEGVDPATALAGMRAQGISMVVLPEQSISDLEAEGAVAFGRGRMMISGQQERIIRALASRFPNLPEPEAPVLGMTPVPLGDWPIGMVRSVSTGLDPTDAALANAAGLQIIARLSNPDGATDKSVVSGLEWAHELGGRFFLPQGDAVLGRREALTTTAETMERLGMSYLTPEFAKIGGDASMVERMPDRVIRLHTAQSGEMDKLTEAGAVERFAKAVTERNHRVVLIRSITDVSNHPLDSYTEFVREVRLQLEKEKYPMGTPRPFVGAEVSRFVFLAIGLSLFPAVVWLLLTLTDRKAVIVLGGLFTLLLGAACYTGAGRQLTALFAATGYPLLAFVWLERTRPKNLLVGYLAVTAVSLVGGLVVSGLLNGLPFMVKADVFSGVKIAHFLPIGIIGAYYFWKLSNGKDALASPATWGQMVTGAVVLVVFAFMASRTGNDNPAGVSGAELALRSLLETVFPVRPRTKEFLIGFPALMLACGLLAEMARKETSRAGWLPLVMLVAAIGPTSTVNTLCHLHTPLEIGLLRIVAGVVVGGIIGLILWGVRGVFLRVRTG
jgi:hypothetical protein